MDDFRTIVEVFARLFGDGSLDIKWRKIGASFRSNINLTEFLSDVEFPIEENDFVESVFEVIGIARSLVNEEAVSDRDKAGIVSEIFLKDNDELKEYIRVHTSSVVPVLEDVDYECISRRNNSELGSVSGNSALLNFVWRDVSVEDNDSSLRRQCIQVSRKDLRALVDKFQQIIDNLDALSNTH